MAQRVSAVRPALEFEDVRFAYPGNPQPVLRNISLKLPQGQGLMLKGPSGSGKSTLLSLAAGVITAQAGAVKLLGQDWSKLGAAQRDGFRVDHVGYIFQQFNLLPYLGVLDNVVLPCHFSRRRRERACAAHGQVESAARVLLSALGIDESLLGRTAARLSVGQQQRVAAARALIGQPEVVIADEPTSALDEDLRETFMGLLLEQCARSGSALLFVTHDDRLKTHFTQVMDLARVHRTGPDGVSLGPIGGATTCAPS